MADLSCRIIEPAADYRLNEKRPSTTETHLESRLLVRLRVRRRIYCHFLSLFIPSRYAASFRFALSFHSCSGCYSPTHWLEDEAPCP